MKQTEYPIHKKSQATERRITDVIQFFATITKAYLAFEQSILAVTNDLSVYSSEQLTDECNKLSEQRTQLTCLDQQLFEIIDLAGREIVQDPMIRDYQIALAKANMACNTLYRRLRALKLTFQQDNAPVHP